ncbi:MAG TPA: hypothetical protein VK550_31440 [Polyangiaceae bacterium]|nr:hypothetical protein [Polyangiaceae bacterium]
MKHRAGYLGEIFFQFFYGDFGFLAGPFGDDDGSERFAVLREWKSNCHRAAIGRAPIWGSTHSAIRSAAASIRSAATSIRRATASIGSARTAIGRAPTVDATSCICVMARISGATVVVLIAAT